MHFTDSLGYFHKDLLSLTALFFVISLVSNSRNISKKLFIIVLVLSLISILADRMVGLLSVLSLIIYAIMRKNRVITLLAIITFFRRIACCLPTGL